MKNKASLLQLCSILFLCFATVSCGKNDPVVTPFQFLTVGNEWSYNWTTIEGSNGATTTLEDTTEILHVDSMLFDELTNSRQYVLLSTLSYGDLAGICYIYDMRDISLSLFDIKLFYWNCHLGQKWLARRKSDSLYAEVVSMSEVIETPAGFFDCIKIKISKDEIEKTKEDYLCLWISKKYGIIKQENYSGTPTNYKKTTITLKSKNF